MTTTLLSRHADDRIRSIRATPFKRPSIAPKSTIERALELAATGRFRKVEQIRNALIRERFGDVDLHLSGAMTRRQLLDAAANAREQQPAGAL